MHVRRTRSASRRLSGSFCLATAAATVCALALAGCATAAKPAGTSSVQDCGLSRTAANVPVEVEINHGQVSCAVAMTVEKSYAAAIVAGRAPGNGGGGPVAVNGWTCQGFATPELLKTGDASKCAKDGTEILEILKTPA
jgi:hypothetical protein